MNILHVTPLYHPFVAGAESYTKELSERLARRGHHVTVLTMNVTAPHLGKAPAVTDVLNCLTVRCFQTAGRVHGLLSRCERNGIVRKAFGRTGHGDVIAMWADSPYGLAPVLHTLRAGPDVVAVINWYGAWL